MAELKRYIVGYEDQDGYESGVVLMAHNKVEAKKLVKEKFDVKCLECCELMSDEDYDYEKNAGDGCIYCGFYEDLTVEEE